MHDTSNKNASLFFAIFLMCFFPQLQAKLIAKCVGAKSMNVSHKGRAKA
jgi:hypothetical protein